VSSISEHTVIFRTSVYFAAIRRSTVVGMLSVALSACGSTTTPAAPTTSTTAATVSTIALSGSAALSAPGQTTQLTATATLSDGTSQNVSNAATWQSSNTAAATVSSSGLVTAVATGLATITATSQSKVGSLGVAVTIAVTTTFQGTIAGTSNQSGAFTVTIQTVVAASAIGKQSTATAAGTLTLANGGGAVTLNGTFDTAGNTLSLVGGGFALTGTINQGAATGRYTGPNNGSGLFAGLDASRNAVTTLCGTWVGSGGSGVWNLQVSASGAASGITSGGAGVLLNGQLNGTALTLTSSEGIHAIGVVQNGSVTGTFDGGGTFSGSSNACH
jgi:hypothetical protein